MRLHEAHAREAATVRECDELIRKLPAWRHDAANLFARFPSREIQVVDHILAGHPARTPPPIMASTNALSITIALRSSRKPA